MLKTQSSLIDVLNGPFKPLTQEQEVQVEALFDNKNTTDVLQISIQSRSKIQLHLSDLNTLKAEQCLNDNVINVYMDMLNDREDYISVLDTNYRKSYCCSSLFMTQLCGEPLKSFSEPITSTNIAKWTAKMEWFKYEKILLPVYIRDDVHWALIEVDMANRQILWFDSLGGSHYNAYTNTLKNFLLDEEERINEEERIKPNNQSSSNHAIETSNILSATALTANNDPCKTTHAWHIARPTRVPRQSNGHDCGVFAIAYALCEMDNRELGFTEMNLIEFRKKIAHSLLMGRLW